MRNLQLRRRGKTHQRQTQRRHRHSQRLTRLDIDRFTCRGEEPTDRSHDRSRWVFPIPTDRGLAMPRNSTAPCGTYAAYSRHIRNGEQTDAVCREAAAEYSRKRLGCSKRVAVVMVNVTCGYCRQTFIGKSDRRFCSRTCSSRSAGLARTIRSADDRRLTRSHRECAAPGLSYSQRRRLLDGWIKQGRKCTYCDRPATTVDHVLPLVRGGTNYEGNLTPSCKSCNSSKSGWTVIEWRTGHRIGPMRRPSIHRSTLRECNNCSCEYAPKSYLHLFCSNTCREAAHRAATQPKPKPEKHRECPECGALTTRPKYCSQQCGSRHSARLRYRRSVGIPDDAPLAGNGRPRNHAPILLVA